MREPTDTISPASWGFLSLTVIPSFLVLFRPTLWEFVYLHFVDLPALAVAKYLEVTLFQKAYPDTALYFPQVREEAIGRLAEPEKKNIFESMIKFPDRRARWCLAASLAKNIPSSVVVIFLWDFHGTLLTQTMKWFAYLLLVHSYFYATVYFDTHHFISEKIRELHGRFNWSQAFRVAAFPRTLSDFSLQERLSLASIFMATLYLQATLLVTHAEEPSWRVISETILLGIFGFFLVGRTWVLARSYFMDGLTRLFSSFQNFSNRSQEFSIPLHSSSILAQFERVFNELTESLRQNERELSSWMIHETEQSRYRALGEVAGLVVHDLAGPVHTIQFCLDEIKEAAGKGADAQFIEQIDINARRANELVGSLRAYLKNPDFQIFPATRFRDANDAVLRLLRTQFFKNFSQLQIQISEAVTAQSFKVATSDLIHILYNLYRNSVENCLQNGIPQPAIEVKLHPASSLTSCVFTITDNGTGLDPQQFEELTSFQIMSSVDMPRPKSMGLRLTRRLIESLGGEISVLPRAPVGERGTTFLISLPVERLEASPVPALFLGDGVDRPL